MWKRATTISSVPLSTPVEELELVAVDMETTGIDPRRHRVVSVAWVVVRGREIQVGNSGYRLIRGAEVGESAVVHGLTDADLSRGVELPQALAELREVLRGRVMLAHFAALETGFIEHAVRREWGERWRYPVVDTFGLERRHMERMATYPRGEDLRLPRVRERYGLPRYRSHHAGADALACAEVYLAQLTRTRARTLADLQT